MGIALGSLLKWGLEGEGKWSYGSKRKRRTDRRAWTDKQQEELTRLTVGKYEWVSMTSTLLKESPKSVKNKNNIPFYLNQPGKQEGSSGLVLTRVVRSRHSLVSRRKSQVPQRESCVTRVRASKRTHTPLGPAILCQRIYPHQTYVPQFLLKTFTSWLFVIVEKLGTNVKPQRTG